MKIVNRFEEQYQVVEHTRKFLDTWGLKQKYVASVCQIPEQVFSKFLTCQRTLSAAQLRRVLDYMEDYKRRNN